MFEEKFFIRKKVNRSKLLNYGFSKETDGYIYTTELIDGQMKLFVNVLPDGSVSTQMIDVATNEEYLLYKVASSVGTYVGEVRAECESVLEDISNKCFEPNVFNGEQTSAVIEYVRNKYGNELEFLWEKFDDNAIWRRNDNKKWYALLVKISKRKLGLDSDEIVEAIIIRLDPAKMADTIDNEKYFPGWHMSKKSWYTVILDGSVPFDELCERIDESYRLAKK